MTIEPLLSILVGLAGGLAVGSGFVAFISVLGIIPRLVQLTRSYHLVQLYEWAVITGAIAGSVFTLHQPHAHLPSFLAVPVGLAAGMFVGMLAAGLTEVLNVFPILSKRVGMENNILVLLMALVLGKITGSLFHWLYFVNH
ncbi:stage V sporulation protein AB [Thalassorhabdus alkalitolerans]|uniref:Stage V sporulation protein AB n=1 Tax=Thalassorhabdus alkalitolerans TaxID=2282697 RepID=A0ABW0YRW4_9BACI